MRKRNNNFNVRVDDEELSMVNELCEWTGFNKTELFIFLLKKYYAKAKVLKGSIVESHRSDDIL